MDPDRCLADLLGEARQVLADDANVEVHADSAVEMAASILALHDWLAGGGFLPAAWASGRGEASSPASGAHSSDTGAR